MSNRNFYYDAHLIVSAIRVYEHQHATPPALEDISKMLSISLDETNRLSRMLHSRGIVDVVTKAGETRLFIADHTAIEHIEQEEADEAGNLSAELARFQQERDAHKKKIADIQAQQKKKREALKEELDRKLKAGLKDQE